MDSNIDTFNIDIDTIDINIDIDINDIEYIDIDINPIDLSNFRFQFSMKTSFVPKLIEITCS